MRPPLAGRRVIVTRAAHQADALVASLEAAGAEAVRLPLIELAPPPDPLPLAAAARRAADYDWLVFTSANAVRAFLPLVEPPLTMPAAVVGPATARALADYGVEPRVAAGRSDAAGLVESLTPRLAVNARVLVPQAADARADLVDGLRAAGADVVRVVAYDKRLPEGAEAAAEKLFAAGPVGWVTFTSPRIARHFAGLLADRWAQRRKEVRAASIGPVTSGELRRLGVEEIAQAARPTDGGLLAAIVGRL